MTKKNQEKEFEFPPMRVLDRKTKELIKNTVIVILVRICTIYKFKTELPKSVLNKEIKELYNNVESLQSMHFKPPREYHKFVEKCVDYANKTVISTLSNFEYHLTDIIDIHALVCVCSHTFDSTDIDILRDAMTCTTGNKLLKLIKFKTPKA